MSKKKLIPVFNIRQIAAHTDLIPVQEERYNFTLDITLCFSFDGTEAEAKEKIDEDIKENLCQGCEKAKKIYDLT